LAYAQPRACERSRRSERGPSRGAVPGRSPAEAPRVQRDLEPLVELVGVQTTGAGVVAQRVDGRVAVGVRGPRLVGPGARPPFATMIVVARMAHGIPPQSRDP
jgi:hypothetical protein